MKNFAISREFVNTTKVEENNVWPSFCNQRRKLIQLFKHKLINQGVRLTSVNPHSWNLFSFCRGVQCILINHKVLTNNTDEVFT